MAQTVRFAPTTRHSLRRAYIERVRRVTSPVRCCDVSDTTGVIHGLSSGGCDQVPGNRLRAHRVEREAAEPLRLDAHAAREGRTTRSPDLLVRKHDGAAEPIHESENQHVLRRVVRGNHGEIVSQNWTID